MNDDGSRFSTFPNLTPPTYERTDTDKFAELRNLVADNHLSLLHVLGQIASAISEVKAELTEHREILDQLRK